jgi:hypothetical protein
VTHCLDVELEDLAVTLHPHLQAVIAGQVELQGLRAGATEAATLQVLVVNQQTGAGAVMRVMRTCVQGRMTETLW